MAGAAKAYQQADYAQAEKLLLAALKEAEKFGEQVRRLAASLNNLASLYYVQGKYAQAQKFPSDFLRGSSPDPSAARRERRKGNFWGAAALSTSVYFHLTYIRYGYSMEVWQTAKQTRL
ncbi:MAG: tetratricopeptide repeat protein, partial [Alphaproteobacteria bacterium]|nr:tetratricopeptide repeat protein [Alphaproteobacteria bacterium]